MKLQSGSSAPNFSTESMRGHALSLDSFSGQRILLQFYRFAGCPVCNLHIREYMRRDAELKALGVNAIAFFHSPRASLEKYMADVDMPFDIVPDPDKVIYRQYGVETSWKVFFTGQVVKEAARAGKAGFSLNPWNQEGGLSGLPATFLIDQDRVIRHAHYGKDAADTPSVDRALEIIWSVAQPTSLTAG